MFEQPFIVIFGAAVRPDGSPSGALRDRVGAAVRFGRRLLPPPIYIACGGQGKYGPPEAEVMAELLVNRGIHPDYIVPDPDSRNTLRSALFVARLLQGQDGPVYAATSGYHLPRCVLLLGMAGLDAHRSPPAIGPASSRMIKRWWWRLRELPAIPLDCLLMLWFRYIRGFGPPPEYATDETADGMAPDAADGEHGDARPAGGEPEAVEAEKVETEFPHPPPPRTA